MGRTAIYVHAVVQTGGRIELPAPAGLREGDELDVVLLADDLKNGNVARRHVADILESLPPGIGRFKSAQEADAYLRKERDSWER